MVPRTDGTIEDLSGNGNHGTINGPVFEFSEIGPGMRSAAQTEEIDCGTGFQSLTDVSMCFWVKSDDLPTSNEWAVNYFKDTLDAWGVQILDIAGNTILRIQDDIDNAGTSRYSTQILNGVYYFVVAIMDGLENKLYLNSELIGSGESSSDYWNSFTGNLYINGRGLNINPLDGNVSNVKIFNRALTESEIQAEYNAGAKAVNFKTNYGVTETVSADTSGELSNSPFRVESGSFHISNDTINGCSAKVIDDVTAGVVQIPSAYFHGGYTQAAHGTFECLMYQGNAANETDFVFIGNQNTAPTDATFNGYSLRFGSAQQVSLIKWTNGVLGVLGSTAAAAINTGQWYRVKVTVSAGGEFSFYLDDILVDVSGGSGSNPVVDTSHTTSKHLLFSFGASDKAAYATKNGDCSIVKYQGIV
jgi:hypothetical protein